MILKWLPMSCLGFAAGCWIVGLLRMAHQEYLAGIFALVHGCFFLLLILAMRALTD